MMIVAIGSVLGCAGVPDDLARPNRIALGSDGTLYVSDFHHDRIVRFDADGRFLGTFGEQGIGWGQLWRVTALAVTHDGALLVANRRPENDDRGDSITFEIVRFEDGVEVDRTVLDDRTLQPEGWVDAIAEAPGADAGTLVIADSAHGELVEVDAEGRRVGRFGGVPRIDAAPSGLRRVGPHLWVVEQFRHRVSRVGSGGDDEILVLDDAGHGQPRFPSAVGVCQDRWLEIADFSGHRVQRYDLAGHWLSELAPDPVGPDQPVQLMDLAVSADCSRSWLVDSKGDRVLVTDADGAITGAITRW